MLKKAFEAVFPGKEFRYIPKVRYSGRFKGYNGSIQLQRNLLTLSLSKLWKDVDKTIQQGMAEELVWKLFRRRYKGQKPKTLENDMYHMFLQKAHVGIIKTQSDPILKESFNRVNELMFSGLMEQPNLAWLKKTISKLGSYDYGTDTISISPSLEEEEELIDYVMYHEMLHKKLKYSAGKRKRYHSKEFRDLEKQFPRATQLEEELKNVVRKAKREYAQLKKRWWWYT